ncbi:MAG: hypothetical protein KC421_24395 [Anaerolineales bacterium]|nr:hypothetical protein [Anaerolineales bacterium]
MSEQEWTKEQEAEAQKTLDLLNRVNGDHYLPEEEAKVRKILSQVPEGAVIFADLVRLNRDVLVEKIIKGKSSQIALEIQIKQMQTELGYKDSSLLERMVIDNIIDSWLHLQHVQHYLNYWLNRTGSGWDAAAYWEKRMDTAQRRFLRACTALTRIRKMQVTAVQVNISRQQVNQIVTK